MARKFKMHTLHTEFELDLAPLLAVMVKLVPVLITSSVFVQIMVIESELPQGVQASIEESKKETLPQISLEISSTEGLTLEAQLNNQTLDQKKIPLTADKKLDLNQLQLTFREFKQKYPDVFQLKLNPDANVSYDEIVKIIDSARKSTDTKVQFPIKNQESAKVETTPFMFPDVVFANLLDG